MSDDFHRPTLTFPSGAYNATQVRLYGIKAREGIIFAKSPHTLKGLGGNVSVQIETEKDDEFNASAEKALKELRAANKKLTDEELFVGIVRGTFKWPFPNPIGLAFQLSIDTKKLGSIVISASMSFDQVGKTQKILSCGIIVGYSYEGHTYDLPKPKIMIIPTLPEAKIPADDSGFDLKEKEGYAVWIVDKLDECVELEMNQGFVEQLVLDANLPGKRAPSMYAGRMMLGHRSGRLSE